VTKNGPKVAKVPSHCVWTFEDADGRVHVWLSCVLPSSICLTTAQLDKRVNDTGNVLRVHMYHRKPFSILQYQHTACKWEGISQGLIQYFLDGQKKEIEKLVKLTKSKLREKTLLLLSLIYLF
jgi:hypothetical protein